MLESELSPEIRVLLARATEEANLCSPAVIDAVRPQVARWEYATGPFYTMDPLHNEISGVDPGRILKRPPARAKNIYCFGFDAQSRLIWWENRRPTGINWSVQISSHLRANVIDDQRREPRVLGVAAITRTAVIARTAFRQGPTLAQRRWAAREETLDARGRPVHVWLASPDGVQEYRADYDDVGLTRLRVLPHDVVIWERPVSGDASTLDYEERLTLALSARIERAAAELGADVALLVHGSEGSLPPQLAFANSATMAGVPAEARCDPHSMHGDIGDWPTGFDTLSLDDPELVRDGRRIQQLQRDAGRAVLVRIAKRLSGRKLGSADQQRRVSVLTIDLDRGEYAAQFREQVDDATWARIAGA